MFSKTGVGANAFGQVLGTRQEREVPVMGSEILTCPGKLRCRGSFFQKCLCGQSCSHRPWAQDGKVRSWQWAKKIPHVLASFGTGTLVFGNGCGGKCFWTSLGHKTGARGPCHGVGNFDMSRQAPVPEVVFSKMLVWAKLFAQTLGPRRESEVPTTGK